MRVLKDQFHPHELHLLSFSELKSKKGIGYSREHLRRLALARRFPRSIKLGDAPNGRIAWSEHEIDQWLAERIADRDKRDAVAA